jgi:hypothetical protein
MKRLIRNRATKAYLAAAGGWTIDYAAAAIFPDTATLIRQAQEINGAHLEEVLMLGDQPSDQDVIIPLTIISGPS